MEPRGEDPNPRRERPPETAEPPQDVEHGGGPDECLAALREHHQGIGQQAPHLRRNPGGECLALQRGEAERGARPILRQHEAHGAMAEAAGAVEEQDAPGFEDPTLPGARSRQEMALVQHFSGAVACPITKVN